MDSFFDIFLGKEIDDFWCSAHKESQQYWKIFPYPADRIEVEARIP